jgi:hypothetical protein
MATPLRVHALFLAIAFAGCAAPTPDRLLASELMEQEARELAVALSLQPQPALAPGELRVLLAFGGAADLDLFVTTPSQETVYFANSPSHTSADGSRGSQSGELLLDQRCDSKAPRIEAISFKTPAKGRYRVGVDFPKRCDGGEAPVSLVVATVGSRDAKTRSLVIRPLEFSPIVMEFDWP